MRYQTEFKVKNNPEHLYDLIFNHFVSLGYKLKKGVRPFALSFTKGSHFGWTIESTTRNLSIAIMPSGDEVRIRCTFELPEYWVIGRERARRDRMELELEVRRLGTLMENLKSGDLHDE
jgi:hypothetical protein